MNTKLRINMITSTICKPISMFVSYIYVSIVLNYLGIEKYGIWSTILTILSWISYFDIGIGNGLRNKLTESIGKKDGESKKLVSSAYAFIAVIMIMVTIIITAIASFVNWKRIFGVKNIQENLAGVVIVSFIFITINFILSICKNILYALQKAAEVSVMELAVQLINMVCVLIVMRFFESNLFIMAFIYGGSMLIVNITASIVLYKKNENIRPSFKNINIKIGKSIIDIGIRFFIIQICALVLFTTDSVIISYLYGASDVTPYNTVNKMFQIIIGVFTALLSPIWSAITERASQKRFDEIKKIIRKLYMMMIPFFVGTIILMLFFIPISRIWLQREIVYQNYLIQCGAAYCIVSLWTNTHGTIANGLGLVTNQMNMAIIQAVVNIPISLYFAKECDMGSAGVMLGTVIALLISSFWLPILINGYLKWRSK